MKKLIVALSLLLTSHFSNSQNLPLEIGFHGGPNINSIRGNYYAEEYSSAGWGFNLGLDLKYSIAKRFRLVLSPGYQRVSVNYNSIDLSKFENYIGRGNLKSDFNFILIPLMAEVLLGSKSNFKISGGPFMGFFIDHTNSYKILEANPDDPPLFMFPVDSKANYGMNYGLALGAGIRIPINNQLDLNFDIRDEFGLANLNNSETSENFKVRTNSFNLLLGVSFKLN